MSIKKMVLYLIAALLGVVIANTWMHDYPPVSAPAVANKASEDATGNYTPGTFDVAPHKQAAVVPGLSTAALSQDKNILVKTDLFDLVFSARGGNLISAKLLRYPVAVNQPQTPMQILNPNTDHLYIAQSGVTNAGDINQVLFSSEKTEYTLSKDQQQIQVILTAKTNGLILTKTYLINKNDYTIVLNTTLKNEASTIWHGSFYQQLIRRNLPKEAAEHNRSYDGAAYYTQDTPYQKLTYKKMSEEDLDVTNQGGWIAMQQAYFLSAFIPEKSTFLRYYSHAEGDQYTLGYVTAQNQVSPGQTLVNQSKLYVGPEIATNLEKLAPGLKLTIDYGFLTPISVLIFWAMQKIHFFFGNWGWSIVLVTLLIKLAFYTLSNKSYLSMARMRELQPKMQALKERYGDDKQALGKATMELYKKEQINPMGGCMPMVVQIPVFFSLYYVLVESVQLRQAPFIFWIHDLSVKDPYFVLPILMGITMLIQSRLNPPSTDPTQAKIMMLMPVIFTVFFFSFPAGLVLYWLTNSMFSIAQQWWVMKTYDPVKDKARKKITKKK